MNSPVGFLSGSELRQPTLRPAPDPTRAQDFDSVEVKELPRLKARQIQGDVILIDRHRAGSVRIERVQSDPADKEGRRVDPAS